MRLLWVTPVTFGKTIHQWGELGTASALKRKGWEIDFLSHENDDNSRDFLEGFGFGHIPVKSRKIPGLFNFFLNRNISRIMTTDMNLDQYDVILSEWQTSLGVLNAKKRLESRGVQFPPWLFEDRSPPAHKTILGRFQWFQYRKSWLDAANSSDAIEVLVPGLEMFVRKNFGITKKMVHCPSGVDLDKFQVEKSTMKDGELKFVYHGSLTKGRGLKKIIEFGNKLESSNYEFRITVFGSGPMESYFHTISRNKDWFIFLGELAFDYVPLELRKHDIGLLPLPKALPWDVGSPLKAMEYAASGLCVLATNVDGSIPFEEFDWYFVGSSQNPIPDWMKNLEEIERNLKNLGEKARKDAETHLSWDSATTDLHNELLRIRKKE